VILRGKGDDSRDLVIARDYISHGLRAGAAHLATSSSVEARRHNCTSPGPS
jgi:type IV secretory pathway VirD2 relaxase